MHCIWAAHASLVLKKRDPEVEVEEEEKIER